jgi:hypothetical protein
MADAADSKSVDRKVVWVRLPPPAPSSPHAYFPVFVFCRTPAQKLFYSLFESF